MQKITPFLWFDGNAEEAMNFYTSVFKDGKILNIQRMSPDGPLFTGAFSIEGQEFMVLNGGPKYAFTPAISLFVSCEDQGEIDHLWHQLTADGAESRCGWLVDKFGISWQIIPKNLGSLLFNPDKEKAQKAMEAMLQMGKIDIQALLDAQKD
jgi:predicted 3-demethylubiquinone-9 3-methyltransferase (glyoxalase superfamily)